MNIQLLPHTLSRHFAIAWVEGSVAIVTWWLFVSITVAFGPTLYQYGFFYANFAEGPWFLGTLVATLSFTSLLAEGTIRRRFILWRLFFALFAGLLGLVLTVLWVVVVNFVEPYVATINYDDLVRDPSFVSLRFREAHWLGAGFISGLAPLLARFATTLLSLVRKYFGAKLPDWMEYVQLPSVDEEGASIISHLLGGTAAGMIAGAIWHLLGLNFFDSLYYPSFFACMAFGLVHGGLMWGVPSELYAGWIRVLSPVRFGLRIPVDSPASKIAERFVGHYPRGLDIFLPADQGVAELHASFVVDDSRRYAVRGLSQQPIMVKRMLESVDLRYDPRSPAPLETTLSMEDKVQLGEGAQYCTIEFIMLPKEEQ